MTASKIEWCDRSDWNPIRGCTRVSRGCGGPGKAGGCYAERIAARFSDPGQPFHGFAKRVNGEARWTGKVALVENRLTEPLHWRKPAKIFVCSTADLFHEALPDAAIDQVFAVMALCPQHIFQLLTKRPERMRAYIQGLDRRHTPDGNMRLSPAVALAAIAERHKMPRKIERLLAMTRTEWPLPNLWLGVSVEDQDTADARIPVLLDTPAALRFISAEPLLGPVDLYHPHANAATNPLNTSEHAVVVDWVIAGGESGPGARPAHPAWFRSLRDQCAAAGVAFHFKQWGAWTPGENVDRQAGIVDGARWFDDRWLFSRENLARDDEHRDYQPDLYRIGKRAAGALLDGRAHREFPR